MQTAAETTGKVINSAVDTTSNVVGGVCGMLSSAVDSGANGVKAMTGGLTGAKVDNEEAKPETKDAHVELAADGEKHPL